MKIGIMADSHENMPLIARAIEIFNEQCVEIVFHAGDIISPITVKEFKNLKAKFVAVFGNNDGERFFLREKFKGIGEIYEDCFETSVGGKRIILLHKPFFLDGLLESRKYDVIIYGHTHKIDIREGRTLVINPGECGGWLTGNSTIAVLDLERMKVDMIKLNEPQ